jgi:hypothetical protein
MNPARLRTKNDSAGKGQHKFTPPTYWTTAVTLESIRQNPHYWRPLPSSEYVKKQKIGKTCKVLQLTENYEE